MEKNLTRGTKRDAPVLPLLSFATCCSFVRKSPSGNPAILSKTPAAAVRPRACRAVSGRSPFAFLPLTGSVFDRIAGLET